MSDAETLRAGMVNELARNHWLRSPAWTAAFSAVPREVFLPRFFAPASDNMRFDPIDDHHPDWLQLVYRNAVWPTQLDGDDTRWNDARVGGPITGEPTCSSTQPSLMASMLEALDIRDGHRVLEIGTGTGYNAALLSHRLHSAHVASIDIDPGLIDQARHALTAAGYTPTLRATDGKLGHPDSAPYDRLIATCAVGTVPPAWLTQVRPGGLILTNLYRHLIGGALVRLAVRPDGSASGHLLNDSGGFMPLRAERTDDLWHLIQAAGQSPASSTHHTHLPPLGDTTDADAWLTLADLIMIDVQRTDLTRDDGTVHWLAHPDGSWAYHDPTAARVEQGGPRRLWCELERIHAVWTTAGSPARAGIGVTVTATGDHRVWLNDEENDVTPRG